MPGLEVTSSTEAFHETALMLTQLSHGYYWKRSDSEIRGDNQELPPKLTTAVLRSQLPILQERPYFNSPYTLDDQVTVCHQNLHFSHSVWCSQYKNRRNSVSSICAIWSHSICTVRTQGPFCCCSSWTRYVTLDWSKKYESIDRYICIAARKILENHLWYRSGCRILDQNPVTDKLKIKLIGRKNAKLMRIEWQKMVQ